MDARNNGRLEMKSGGVALVKRYGCDLAKGLPETKCEPSEAGRIYKKVVASDMALATTL